MKTTYCNGLIYYRGQFVNLNIIVEDEVIIAIDQTIQGEKIDCHGLLIAPGFIDPHVHLREPGFTYKETISSGTKAAAKGGYTKIFLMPNVNPAPDNCYNLQNIHEIINRDSSIQCYQLATITKGRLGKELVDIDSLSPLVIGFSDDGSGVQSANLMYQACLKAYENEKVIIAHAEDDTLINQGYIHDGSYASKNNHQGILSISETCQVARDLVIAAATKAHYHLCHVSAKETIELIRHYKKSFSNITVEVTPHHLLLNDSDLKEDGAYKMNPPLRSHEDQKALITALCDGTIDCIATDHAPHSHDEKSQGLKNSLFGIGGLEIAFSVLYTKLVVTKILSLEKLLDLMSKNVSDIFKIPSNQIEVGNKCNIVLIDLESEFLINAQTFLSMGQSTPFDKMVCYGSICKTICDGKVVYEK